MSVAGEPHQRRRAERHPARAETLPGFRRRPDDFDNRVDRRAAVGSGLAAEPQLQLRPFAGRAAEGRPRSDPRSSQPRNCRSRARACGAGSTCRRRRRRRRDCPRHRRRPPACRFFAPPIRGLRRGPRRCRASASRFARAGRRPRARAPSRARPPCRASPSTIASICVPISGTSAAMKPWISDSERTPSRPCMARRRSTKPRIGSRLVGKTSIIRQSKAAMAGPDFAAERAQREVDDMLRALDKIGVRKFEEGREDVGVRHALFREMAVRVEFGGDQTRSGRRSRARAPADRPRSRRSPARPSRRAGRGSRRRPAARRAVDRGSRRAGPHRPCAATTRPAPPRPPCLRSG